MLLCAARANNTHCATLPRPQVLPEIPTVAGTVERDLAFISPVIGVKTAVSDHRSSQEGPYHLRNLAAQAQNPRP